MSWSIDLKANRKISPRSVSTALRHMGAITDSTPTQDWGWSCEVDVDLPKGRTLTISGAGFSASQADPFATQLASELRKLHYKVKVLPFTD